MACGQIGLRGPGYGVAVPTRRGPGGVASAGGCHPRGGDRVGETKPWITRTPLQWLLLPNPLNLCRLGWQRCFPGLPRPRCPQRIRSQRRCWCLSLTEFLLGPRGQLSFFGRSFPIPVSILWAPN